MSGNRISTSRPDEAVREVTEYLRTVDLLRSYLATTADHFGVAAGTLSRALIAGGTSYTELVEAERRRRVPELVEQFADFPKGKQIHRLLGYRQVNSFYRWVRRWAPNGWRGARHVLP
jgi:hypothetical protein